MELKDYIGEVVDIILVNGNYYPEVEIVAIDNKVGGLFIRDSPMYSNSETDPYFVSSIAEIRRLRLPEDIQEVRDKAKGKKLKEEEDEKSVVQVWPVKKQKK